jgi:hypothetical protein
LRFSLSTISGGGCGACRGTRWSGRPRSVGCGDSGSCLATTAANVFVVPAVGVAGVWVSGGLGAGR